MTHNQKLWLLVAVLAVIWVLRFLVVPAMSQGYYPPPLNPYVHGPGREPYRGRGFERDYQDYRDDGYRQWAPPPR